MAFNLALNLPPLPLKKKKKKKTLLPSFLLSPLKSADCSSPAPPPPVF